MNYLARCIAFLSLGCILLGPLYAMEQTRLAKKVTKDDLLGLISEGSLDEATTKFAQKILDKVFECAPRAFGSSDGTWFVYSIHPEILSDLMRSCVGKTVLEIAGASGENALCIGLAGAEKVYLHDCAVPVLKEFERSLQRLPKELQKKFQCVPGDCFEVFNNPEYTGLFDVIYARNIFQYVLGEKRERFIALVSRLLKPGGRLVLTVTSTNMSYRVQDTHNKIPEGEPYVFLLRTPMIMYQDGRDPVSLFNEFTALSDIQDIDLMHKNFHYRSTITFLAKGMELDEGYRSLSQENQRRVLRAAQALVKEHGANYLCQNGVKINNLTYTTVVYTQNTLRQAFSHSDVEMLSVRATDESGHITDEEDKVSMLTATFQKSLQEKLPNDSNTPSQVRCAFCKHIPAAAKKCGRCHTVIYCSVDCQKSDWTSHKVVCK